MLLLASFGLFGQFYAYDVPGTLYHNLKEHMASPENGGFLTASSSSPAGAGTKVPTQKALEAAGGPFSFDVSFNLLYSIYSFPNILVPLYGGLFIDHYGLGFSIRWLSVITATGSVLFAVGCVERSWALMLLGRGFFGLGGESLQVGRKQFDCRNHVMVSCELAH